jgi:hypothetical protein
MNSTVQTWLYSQVDSAVLLDVQRLFHSFEKRLSRFDAQSELSRLNAHDGELFQVSPILLDAVEVALVAAETTAGLYDPTVLDALEKAGYDRSFEQLEQPAPLGGTPLAHLPATLSPGYFPPSLRPFTFRSVSINRARREIYNRWSPAGFGGMGKAERNRAPTACKGLALFWSTPAAIFCLPFGKSKDWNRSGSSFEAGGTYCLYFITGHWPLQLWLNAAGSIRVN